MTHVYTIDAELLGERDGFEIRAYIENDDSGLTPHHDFDCYSEEDVEAWRRSEWQFVTVIVEALAEDVVLGSSVLGGVEYGSLPSAVDENGEPIDGYEWWKRAIDEHEMVSEAIDAAREKLNRIEDKITVKS